MSAVKFRSASDITHQLFRKNAMDKERGEKSKSNELIPTPVREKAFSRQRIKKIPRRKKETWRRKTKRRRVGRENPEVSTEKRLNTCSPKTMK